MSRLHPSASFMWRGAALLSLCASAAHGQQIAKLTADDASFGDYFGLGVSISGDTTIIGANGDDDGGAQSGSAYVFREVGGAWQQIAKLNADDTAADDKFGASVSISGDTVVIGASYDDDAGQNSGSAYIFREIGGVWQQVAKLTADDASAGEAFGVSVSINGDTAAIGAADSAGRNSGSAYIFRESGGTWQQMAKLTADDAAPGDSFGWSVSISGDTALVGAMYDDDAGGNSGSAYVFREVSGIWQQIAKLTAGDGATNDDFGFAVSISGASAVVGALYDDDEGSDSGSAYVFRELDGEWQQVAKLTADDGAADDHLGISVSISGETALIGANLDDDTGGGSGSAYVFRDIGGVWQQVTKVTAADGASNDSFGIRVSISSDTIVVGSAFDDDAGADSGSAYVFNVAPSCPADFNGDGSVNTLDVLGFLNAWAAADPSADFNGDGTVNTLDVLAFLNAWAAGC